MPRILRKPDKPYQYGTANFRSFENPRRKEWIGEPVAFQSAQDHEYCFAVFSDVTGSEFPMSTRRGGYYVYRALAQELTRDRVSFAVSVGDMATCAGVAAYRRLRQILRHIKVPLAVAPGNHDLFADDEYRPQFFHSLFGPDNCAFQIGPVGFVLLNNAYGWISDEQFAWLEEALKKNGSRFKLVFCHKPPLDPRAHEYYGMEIRECAERMRKLFAEHGVTAVFSGHIHELLTAEEDGVTYIISGGGGSKLDSSEAVHHYLLVDVTEYQLTVRAVPLTVRGDATTKREPLLELTFPIST